MGEDELARDMAEAIRRIEAEVVARTGTLGCVDEKQQVSFKGFT
jgi:hypothetical protein